MVLVQAKRSNTEDSVTTSARCVKTTNFLLHQGEGEGEGEGQGQGQGHGAADTTRDALMTKPAESAVAVCTCSTHQIRQGEGMVEGEGLAHSL